MGIVVLATAASAQEALRNSLAGDAAAEARRAQLQDLPFTFKVGDFRTLATTSLEQRWNDNVSVSSSGVRQQDFILTPTLQLNMSYPVTAENVLQFNVGVGYDLYFEHRDLSGVRVFSGSALSYDAYIKDFWINLHDRFSDAQDSANHASIANSARYGGLDNTVGLAVTWDLRAVVLTVGYDHQTFIALADEFDYLNRSSELLVARAGFRINPALTAGLEATGGFTTYDDPVLNDNQSYSAGLYADWRLGKYSRFQARGGYTFYYFDQTSLVTPAVDQHAWYADLTVSQAITETITYSLSAGRELRLGVYSDTSQDWYVRPNIAWRVIRDLSLNTYVSYEKGKQGLGFGHGPAENYDWIGMGFGVSYELIKKLTASLTYRLTLRSSNISSREYTQNEIGIRFSYQFR